MSEGQSMTPNLKVSTLLAYIKTIEQYGFPTGDSYEIAKEYGLDDMVSYATAAAIFREAGAEIHYRKTTWANVVGRDWSLPGCMIAKDGTAVMVLASLHPGDIHPTDNTKEIEEETIWTLRIDEQFQETAAFETQREVSGWWQGPMLTISLANPKPAQNGKSFSLSWFLREALRDRKLAAWIVVAIFVVHLFGLGIPLFFQAVIDKVVPNEAINTLYTLVGGIVVIVIFEGVLSYFRDLMIGYVANRVDISTSTLTFRHLLSLPMQYFHNSSAGVITQNMSQAEQIRDFVTSRLAGALVELSSLVIFFPILYIFYSTTLTLVVAFGAVLMTLVILVVLGPFNKQLKIRHEAEGKRQQVLVESITGMQTIKSLSLERARVKEWDSTSIQVVKADFSIRKMSAATRSIVEALDNLVSVAVLAIGVYQVINGTMSVGALIAFRMLSGQVTQPIQAFSGLIFEFVETSHAAKMLGVIMDTPAERSGGRSVKATGKGASIRFEGVTFFFPEAPGKPILENVSFEVRPGERIGIAGPSGSGKSTIARLILGLNFASSGQVLIDGLDTKSWNLKLLRRRISTVLQENFLFNGNVRDNVASFNAGYTDKSIRLFLEGAGALEFVQSKQGELNEIVREAGTNFSGGQRQRLAIARAIARNHDILIFDEATSALDIESETIIQRKFNQISYGKTTFVIAHRLSTLKNTDRVLCIEDGSVMAFAPFDDLISDTTPYPKFRLQWEEQTSVSLGNMR